MANLALQRPDTGIGAELPAILGSDRLQRTTSLRTRLALNTSRYVYPKTCLMLLAEATFRTRPPLQKRNRVFSSRQIPLLPPHQRLLPRCGRLDLGSCPRLGRSAHEIHQQACSFAARREELLPVLRPALWDWYHAAAAGTARCHLAKMVL